MNMTSEKFTDMEERLASTTTPLSKKTFLESSIGHPFPNYTVGEWELPVTCRCIYDGSDFFVISENDIHTLYNNGSFGVSNLTFRGPQGQDESYKRKPYYKKMVERIGLKRKLLEQLTTNDKMTTESNIDLKSEKLVEKSNKSSNTQQDVAADALIVSISTISTSLESNCTVDDCRKSRFKEKLMLMAEEVIFLSFGVGCLTIQSSSGEMVSYDEIWKNLVAKDPEFVISYAVYHYFRSKNWVPKIGISYGGSYILYKIGPEYYHANYIVYIIGYPSRPRPNWREMYAFQRLARHVGKHVVLCDVTIPKNFSYVNTNPRSIFKLRIEETCIYRWKPVSQEVY